MHIGLVLAYVGPHGRAVVGQEGYISRHRALGYMGGPSWPKRVAFLGTAPGPGCILGVSWLYVGRHGRAVVAQEGCISRHRAWSRWACLIRIGLVLAYVGPHGRAVVAQEGLHF